MTTRKVHHFTLRCDPQKLASLRDFYRDVLGLREGPRPQFDFPGHWLYSEDHPVVHLAGLAGPGDDGGATGHLDHISFAAEDIEQTRAVLRGRAIPWEEAPVPGWPLYQIFLRDPMGLKIELTFDRVAAGQD